MTYARTAIQDFITANKIYIGAKVTAYLVSGGVKTNNKANLYSSITGSALLSNPQTLDSFGKFRQPIYIQDPIILTVTGLGNTPDHDTGIIDQSNLLVGTGSPEGVVTAVMGTIYTNLSGGAGTTLYVKESGTGNIGWSAK